MFSSTSERLVEWGDCDPAGIVFYPRFFAFFDAATAHLMEAASGLARGALCDHYAVLGWPMVDTRATFRAPVRFDDRVRIASAVGRLGRASFDIRHRLTLREVLCAECVETRVWAARPSAPDAALESREIPAPLRAQLSAAPHSEPQTPHELV